MSDRTGALWRRLADMFGAERLRKAFGATPPPTWEQALARLKDFELERGMRRLVYGGKGHIPSLPEFLRMCREVGGEQWADADEPRLPPAQRLEAPSVPRWTEQANLHLLGYITRRTPERNRLPAEPLVEAKNAWAEDMREAEARGDLPQDNGKAWWAETMRNAEAVVDRIVADRAAACR
jgi:hypothetical protein